MQGRIAAVLAALVLAVPAGAQPATQSRLLNETTLLLVFSERVTIRLAADGHLTVVSAEAIAPSDLTAGPDRSAPPGAIAFSTGVLDDALIMKVENRGEHGFEYYAALLEGVAPPVRGEFTSVCNVHAGLFVLESWPKRRVPAMLITHLVPTDRNDTVCALPSQPPAAASPAAKPN